MATLSLDFLRNYRLGTYRESEPVAYQYDQGHVLDILVPGAVASAEVQYWTRGMTEAAAYEVGSITQQTDGSYVIECNVPNEFFDTWGDLRVYLVVTDDSKYVVTYEGRIKVLQREKPEDYVDDDPDNEALRVLTEAREAAQSASADADRAAQVAASIPADYSELSGNVSNLTQEVSSINERLGDVAEKAEQGDAFLKRNDMDSVLSNKINVLHTPYDIEDILDNSVIHSNGSIITGDSYKTTMVSPLISLNGAGTYGLKVIHSTTNGNINAGNNYNNGFGFFAADGVTPVTRPSLMQALGNDIYIFEAPSAAAYVRLCATKGAGTSQYTETALRYFNQWILLPDAGEDIDDEFFVLAETKENGSVSKIYRADGSYLELVDAEARESVATMGEDVEEASTAASQAKSQVSGVQDWMTANDLDGNTVKENVLETPYVFDDILHGKTIYSNGTIGDAASGDVSPLVEVSAGIYGLKTYHNNYNCGQIQNGNDYKNGFGFFAADGETVVARPSNMQALGNDIFIFEVPNDAKYVRLGYITGGENYQTTALGFFNQWILLPDADENIDDEFFDIGEPKEDTSAEYLLRQDGSKVYFADRRVGDLSNLETSAKSNLVAAINEVAQSGGGGGDGTAEAWLARNDFDSVAGGKVNVLTVPYTSSQVLDGKQIYSNGTIQDGNNFTVSPLIPITAGTYGLKVTRTQNLGYLISGNDYRNGYGFFGADGETVVARPTNLLHSLGNEIYVFEVPSEASYVRFCYYSGGTTNYRNTALGLFNQWILLPNADDNIDDSFFTLSHKKDNGEVDKIQRLDGSYLEIVDAEARANAEAALARPITFGRRTCAIFHKVCCIGDSYTEGYIMNTSGQAHANNDYSWPTHMANMTGREYVNLGISGATAASWLTNENGLAKMLLPENKSQAYLIGLQINDAQTGLTVGTVADIGTETISYYGCMSKIIDQVFSVNDAAHVFIQTQPKNFEGIHTPYREALINIVDWYNTEGNGTHQEQVHLIDLLDYWKLYQNAGCNDSMVNGHFTAVGWEYVAEILMYAWSNYINANPLLFQDVNLIPYGTSS